MRVQLGHRLLSLQIPTGGQQGGQQDRSIDYQIIGSGPGLVEEGVQDSVPGELRGEIQET